MYLSEMKPWELFNELFCLSQECEARIADWKRAETKEEAELAESSYYNAQEHWAIVYREVHDRNLLDKYTEFCCYLAREGLL